MDAMEDDDMEPGKNQDIDDIVTPYSIKNLTNVKLLIKRLDLQEQSPSTK
jgi:hypothetical protein